MSSKHPPSIDLDALQGRLNDLSRQTRTDRTPSPSDADLPALAIETGPDGTGHVVASSREGVELSAKPRAAPPAPRLGVEAAANMTRLSKAAADDIRQLGLVAFEAGKRVQEECEQMARDVEANGGTIAVHLTGLSQLLADVGMSNRETLNRLLGGVSPSIVQSAGNGHTSEQTVRTAKELRVPSFIKAGTAS
jgi:hypothetical protein